MDNRNQHKRFLESPSTERERKGDGKIVLEPCTEMSNFRRDSCSHSNRMRVEPRRPPVTTLAAGVTGFVFHTSPFYLSYLPPFVP